MATRTQAIEAAHAEEIRRLRTEIAQLKQQLTSSVGKQTHLEEVRRATQRAAELSYEDGWQRGVTDALLTVSPEHAKARAYFDAFMAKDAA